MITYKKESSKRVKRLLAVVFSFILVIIYVLSAKNILVKTAGAVSKQDNTKTVKIGYIDYENFIDKQPDGKYKGYGIDYLKEIAKYTGWNYEYSYDTFSNQMKKLKNGEIDFLCHSQPTRQRRKDYIFSKYPDGIETSVLYTLPGDNRFYYNDFEHFNGMRIAFLKGSFQNDEFADYAKSNGFTYRPQYYDTTAQCFNALNEKKVDGVAMGSLAMQSSYKAVCKFGADPFYFMTGKDNKELLEELNNAQTDILAENPYFEVGLYKKYYGDSVINSQILFTREEEEFISKCGKIKMGFISNRKPFSYINDNGEIDGINVDIIRLVSNKTGLKFDFCMTDIGQTTIDFLSKKPDALLAGILSTNPQFEEKNLIVSNSMYRDDVVLACTRGTKYNIDAPKATYTLAIPRSYVALKEYILSEHPEFKVVLGKTTQECIKMVQSGKADFMAQNKNVITPLMSDPHYEGLTVLPTFFMIENLGIVCNNTETNEMIIGIINKCIYTLTEDELSQFTVDHTIINGYKATFGDFIYKFRYAAIIVSILLFILIVLTIIIFNIKKHNYNIILKKNEQLADAVNQAVSANQSKSQFLARMSHEIRTPMNAIVGLTAIAAHHKTEPDKVEDDLSKIDKSSKLLLNIINDVLDMSAIESSKLKIAHETFNIHEIISSIAEMYYVQCRQKSIEFEINTSNIGHEYLVGDGLRVNQVLLNLISNAYKFTPSGGKIYVEVQETSFKNGRAYVNFYVKDTGEGMSEQMQKNLFKPFEQEEAVTARRHGGSGLGLSIAKNLVEMMHGSISCKSQKGVGTEFLVSIPFDVDEGNIDLKENSFKSLKALIVGDDRDTCDYTAIILKRLGILYEVAESGQKAVELLEKANEEGKSFNICFVDWKMSDMSVIEVVEQMRELYDKDSLVIIISAYDISEVKEQAVMAGADFVLSKPLFQSTVFNILMKLSGGKLVNKSGDVNSYDFGGKKVLLAEDTQFNAEIAIELLQMVNMETVHAKDGEEAIKLFTESEPGTYEAILMDIQMPVIDGYEATRRIRASSHPEAKSIHIFAMTANAFTEDVSATFNAGMNGHIAKPINTEALYAMLKKAVDDNNVSRNK